MTPAVLDVKAAAAYIGVSPSTLYKISAEAGQGAIPVVRMRVPGSRKPVVRFRIADLDAFIDAHTDGAKPSRRTA